MRDLAQIADFSDQELRHMEKLVRSFLAGRCFVRRRGTKTDEQWRFLLKHQAVLAAYFEIAGWEFEVREDLGAAVATPTLLKHARRFSELQTHVVYNLLQVHYDVTSGSNLDQSEVQITYGDLFERLTSNLPPRIAPNRGPIEEACKKLRTYGAISLSPGFRGEPHDVITVHPVLEMLVPRETVQMQTKALEISREERAREIEIDTDDISNEDLETTHA